LREAGLKGAATKGPEELRRIGLASAATKGVEAMREAARKAAAARSPEARRETALKAAETRRRNREAEAAGAEHRARDRACPRPVSRRSTTRTTSPAARRCGGSRYMQIAR
jgi:hypothetical protein